MLHSPSAKEFQLVGTRRGTFSGMGPASMEIPPLEIRMAPTPLASKILLCFQPGGLKNVSKALFPGYSVN